MESIPVARLIVDVVDRVVLPRRRRLASGDVAEKTPGDLVTVADTEAEAELTAVLAAAHPDALVIGEEAVAAEPGLRGHIDEADHVWLVDPVDGTNNFVHGLPDFGCMVVELRRGQPVRSWIWQALRRRMFLAERGGGVRVNGVPLRPPRPARRPLVGGVTPEYADLGRLRRGPTDERGRSSDHDLPLHAGLGPAWPMTGSCTADYPLIALGERDYLIHNGSYPWDHWPGILMLGELGGRVAHLDGEPFRSAADNPTKVVAARTPAVWDAVASAARALDNA